MDPRIARSIIAPLVVVRGVDILGVVGDGALGLGRISVMSMLGICIRRGRGVGV